MPAYGFSLSGLSLPEEHDLLGLWNLSHQQGGAVSFNLKTGANLQAGASAGLPSEPTWRAQLPGSSIEARAMLARQALATQQAQHDLLRANLELERFDPGGASQSFGADDQLAAPKNDLRMAIDALDPAGSAVFGLLRHQRAGAEVDGPGQQQWQAFVAQVRRAVGSAARIETALAGVTVGQTVVSWAGDWTTVWKPDLSPASMHTHLEAVRLALAARIALIRLVSVVAAGAAGLAIKAALPGGQVLLLPAAWRFVRDVLAELRA